MRARCHGYGRPAPSEGGAEELLGRGGVGEDGSRVFERDRRAERGRVADRLLHGVQQRPRLHEPAGGHGGVGEVADRPELLDPLAGGVARDEDALQLAVRGLGALGTDRGDAARQLDGGQQGRARVGHATGGVLRLGEERVADVPAAAHGLDHGDGDPGGGRPHLLAGLGGEASASSAELDASNRPRLISAQRGSRAPRRAVPCGLPLGAAARVRTGTTRPARSPPTQNAAMPSSPARSGRPPASVGQRSRCSTISSSTSATPTRRGRPGAAGRPPPGAPPARPGRSRRGPPPGGRATTPGGTRRPAAASRVAVVIGRGPSGQRDEVQDLGGLARRTVVERAPQPGQARPFPRPQRHPRDPGRDALDLAEAAELVAQLGGAEHPGGTVERVGLSAAGVPATRARSRPLRGGARRPRRVRAGRRSRRRDPARRRPGARSRGRVGGQGAGQRRVGVPAARRGTSPAAAPNPPGGG